MSSIQRSSRHARPSRVPSPSPRSLPEPPRAPQPPPTATQAQGTLSSTRPDRVPRSSTHRLEPVVEGDGRLLRDIRKPTPGDPDPRQDTNAVRRRGSSPALAKQRSLYFEQAFGLGRDGASNPASSSGGDAMDRAVVIAEVKTNVFIPDEMAFLTDLSTHLSQRYARPLSNIAITLQHGACLLLGGSLDPAYLVAIHALPSLLQPATNKRNAVLLQRHLAGTLGVVPARGIVRFVPVPGESFAKGGRTMTDAPGEREEEKIQRRRTIRTFSRLKPGSSSALQEPTPDSPPVQNFSRPQSYPSHDTSTGSTGSRHQQQQQQTTPERSGQASSHDQGIESPKGKRLSHKKSFTFIQSLFGRSGRQDSGVSPEVIPEEAC